MRSFWWFKENSIAGMARPGFNSFNWFSLPFDEAVMVGWIGRYSSGKLKLEAFRAHLQTYVPQIYKFHKLNEESGSKAVEIFRDPAGLNEVLNRLSQRIGIPHAFSVVGDDLMLEFGEAHLNGEVAFLKERNINRIVCLTETHHNREILQKHFSLHHIGVEDLGAPSYEQARELARVIQESSGERLAVHCLAGIGRTSTMLIAAHLLMGEDLDELKARLKKRNPSFAFSTTQTAFIESVAKLR